MTEYQPPGPLYPDWYYEARGIDFSNMPDFYTNQDGLIIMDRLNKELIRLNKEIRKHSVGSNKFNELYIAKQAISWALNPNAAKSAYDMIMGIHSDTVVCHPLTDYTKKEINILGEDKVSLMGIEFTIIEGKTEGYFKLDELSKRINHDVEFIENILTKYRLFGKNGEFDNDYLKVISLEGDGENGGFHEEKGTPHGFVFINIVKVKEGVAIDKKGDLTDEEIEWKGPVFNEEFVLKLIEKDRKEFDSDSEQIENAKHEAKEALQQ